MSVIIKAEKILEGVQILGAVNEQRKKILTKDATAFLTLLHRSFNQRRKQLLERRQLRQQQLDAGAILDFLPGMYIPTPTEGMDRSQLTRIAETKHIRDNDAWKAAPPAPGLADRRVEITGPVDRKMVVNALNADVWTYMADFEGKDRL